MKLKICGIRTLEALEQCVALGVNYIGINFAESSKRKAYPDFYNNIATEKRIQKVGVFQDQSTEVIIDLTRKANLKIIQLHGKESPAFIDQLRQELSDIKVWKAFSIDENFDPLLLQYYSKNCDSFLFDGKKPGSGSQILDNHKLLDAILVSEKMELSFGIAGGINPTNLAEYTRKFPTATFLDTASGAETDGLFDQEKVKLMIDQIS